MDSGIIVLLLTVVGWIFENIAAFAIIVCLLVIILQLAWAIRLLRVLTWNTGKTADYLYEEQQLTKQRFSQTA